MPAADRAPGGGGDAEERLRAYVGPDLSALDALDPAARAHLATLVDGARARQAAAVERALKEAVEHAPRLVRPAVRKALGL